MAGKRFLRRRNEILVPCKFLSPAARFMSHSKVSTGNTVCVPSKAGDVTKVHLFHGLACSIGKIICGGKIGSSGRQACVSNVLIGYTYFSVWSYTTKEKKLVDITLYIQTTS